MKKAMSIVLVLAVLLVAGGIAGKALSSNDDDNNLDYTIGNRMGMSFRYFDEHTVFEGEKLELGELEERVERYIGQYDEDLARSDVFVFSDSDYYFSIMEKDTGIGAMELLVNPYTGDVYPEFGPNMMWNTKYGMHGFSGHGMMGRTRGSVSSYNRENSVSWEEAQSSAAAYIERQMEKGYSLSEEGHEFYGYYTFHIEHEGITSGMLSVNGFTKDVWFHDWHGNVSDIKDSH